MRSIVVSFDFEDEGTNDECWMVLDKISLVSSDFTSDEADHITDELAQSDNFYIEGTAALLDVLSGSKESAY